LSIIGLSVSIYAYFEIINDDNSMVEFSNNLEILVLDNEKQNKLPDIYYIVLDEYAGNQSLKQNFSFDNSEFYKELDKKGFLISSKSFSHYPYTILSVPSSLNMQYLHFNNEIIESKSQIRFITDNNLVMKNLDRNGYYMVSFFAGNEAMGNNNLIDEKVCGEKYFISHYIAEIFPEEQLKEKRNGILCTFEKMGKVKDKISQPIFVYSHFSLPHDPFVVNDQGDLQIFDEKNSNDEKLKQAYIQQLKFANKMSIKVIDEILSDNERDSIIILQSDHGERSKINWENPTNDMTKQALNNINAIYLPNIDDDFTHTKISNVNTFRVIFNEYFNSEFELLDEKYFWMELGEPPFKIKDVTKIIKNNGEY
jgi:hypothetical protein